MMEMNARRRFRVVADQDSQPNDRLTEVLAAVGRGDESAFSELYDLSSSRVFGIVRRVVRNPALAEEITQEVYVEIWRLAPRFDRSKGPPQSWISTIAHRRAVDRVRSEASRTKREDADGTAHATRASDPVGEEVVDSIDRTRVRAALEDLSESQRTAVTLAYYGGHTYREVAALLDVPEGTVKTRIRDGLIKLRDQFGITT